MEIGRAFVLKTFSYAKGNIWYGIVIVVHENQRFFCSLYNLGDQMFRKIFGIFI